MCSGQCRYDVCGVCNGDGTSCLGCDGVAFSNKTLDACGTCGGDSSSCAGCDGVPNSGKVLDRCGVCGGDGQSCIAALRCAEKTTCGQCNILVGVSQVRYCFWCNSTNSCLAYSNTTVCAAPALTCPTSSPGAPGDSTSTLTSNDSGTVAGWLIGVIIAGIVVVAAIAALIFLKARGKGPLAFDSNTFNEQPTYENPLYEEYSKPFDNPIFESQT